MLLGYGSEFLAIKVHSLNFSIELNGKLVQSSLNRLYRCGVKFGVKSELHSTRLTFEWEETKISSDKKNEHSILEP